MKERKSNEKEKTFLNKNLKKSKNEATAIIFQSFYDMFSKPFGWYNSMLPQNWKENYDGLSLYI